MEDKIENLSSYCSGIDFGAIILSDGEKEFYKKLNYEITLLCKSLPESTQTAAIIDSMRYSGISFGEELNFFRNYPAPTWSIIYWLIQSFTIAKELTEKDIKNAITAHSMAMSLHSFDDHLNDGEIPVTHLTLLLRSQSWMIMNAALNDLADGVEAGDKIIQGFIDDYYSGIRNSQEIETIDSYCNRFRKQMATGLIVPVLIAYKMTTEEGFSGAIQEAYESFGIAWRLLDDIKDIEIDMLNSAQSAIYICLPEKIKAIWESYSKEKSDKKNDFAGIIMDYLMENSVIQRITGRICKELESAASMADDYNLTGLADEFRCLLKPLKSRQN